MNRASRCMLSVAVAACLGASVAPAESGERDRKFFRAIEGTWTGPGEIIAGKYKGTKFTCNFAGSSPDKTLGMTLDGGCRVGVFSQKMMASVEAAGSAGYTGTFMDGAKGEGLDIVSGNVVDGNKVVFAISRNDLRGIMQARLPDEDTMRVTVSVKVDKTMVPVIGMNLKRVDAVSVGAIAKE